VTYAYNVAGQLETVQQREAGGSYSDVISDFDDGPAEQVTFKAFGNGVESTYTYDDQALYRLTNIYTATTSQGEGMGFGGGELLEEAPELQPLALAILALQDNHVEVEQLLEQALPSAPAPRGDVELPLQATTTENPVPELPETSDVPEPPEPEPESPSEPDPIPDAPSHEEPAADEEASTTPGGPSVPATSTAPSVDDVSEAHLGNADPIEAEAVQPKPEVLAVQHPISDLLEGKTADERADTKAEEIAKIFPVGEYTDATYGVTVEVQSIEKIERGIEIFARA
jgi:hypothetical protein